MAPKGITTLDLEPEFCLSCLQEQRLVALLQGSVESDDSPASGGDEEEGEKAQADKFSEPISFEAGRSRSGRPTTRCQSGNLQWLLSQEKPLMGLKLMFFSSAHLSMFYILYLEINKVV